MVQSNSKNIGLECKKSWILVQLMPLELGKCKYFYKCNLQPSFFIMEKGIISTPKTKYLAIFLLLKFVLKN
jgi:hypothetical protein